MLPCPVLIGFLGYVAEYFADEPVDRKLAPRGKDAKPVQDCFWKTDGQILHKAILHEVRVV